jgi:hypothetical protein
MQPNIISSGHLVLGHAGGGGSLSLALGLSAGEVELMPHALVG